MNKYLSVINNNLKNKYFFSSIIEAKERIEEKEKINKKQNNWYFLLFIKVSFITSLSTCLWLEIFSSVGVFNNLLHYITGIGFIFLMGYFIKWRRILRKKTNEMQQLEKKLYENLIENKSLIEDLSHLRLNPKAKYCFDGLITSLVDGNENYTFRYFNRLIENNIDTKSCEKNKNLTRSEILEGLNIYEPDMPKCETKKDKILKLL